MNRIAMPNAMRSFDPRRVGRLECTAWVTYYRREYPDNDPDGARRCMQRFYALVKRRHRERFDVAEAARLEVEWWRVHRDLQRREAGDEAALADALAALYAHVYALPAADVAHAARERALAMRYSDQWVADGCDPASPLVAAERAALVRSYAALLAAVHR
jgi:hypothetical protein